MEYEGLHRICTRCGCYGHLYRDCKIPKASPQTDPAATVNNQSHASAAEPQSSPDTAINHVFSNEPTIKAKQMQPGSENIGIEVNGDEDQLHGDWVMVKKNYCNKRNTKLGAANNNNGAKGKGIFDNNGRIENSKDRNKSHAVRDTSVMHARLTPHGGVHQNQENGYIALPSNAKKKRQRNEVILHGQHNGNNDHGANNMATPPESGFIPKIKNNRKDKGKAPVIYDLGNGPMSAMNLQPVSNNRFTWIFDEEVDGKVKSVPIKDAMEVPSTQEDSRSMVPETQLNLVPMSD